MKSFFLLLLLTVAGLGASGLVQRRHSAPKKKAVPVAIVDPAPAPDAMPQPILRYVEQMPEFPGSVSSWLENQARPVAVGGRAAIEFVVRTDGTVVNPKVVSSAGAAADSEAVRLIRSMPAWKPARSGGIPVNVYFTLPVRVPGK